jgi:hypothetical protein
MVMSLTYFSEPPYWSRKFFEVIFIEKKNTKEVQPLLKDLHIARIILKSARQTCTFRLMLCPAYVPFRQLYSTTDRNDETKNGRGLCQTGMYNCTNKKYEQITSTRFTAVVIFLLLKSLFHIIERKGKRTKVGQILSAYINYDCETINYTLD